MADDRLELQNLSRNDVINAVLNHSARWTLPWGDEAIRGQALDGKPLMVYFEERGQTLVIIKNLWVIEGD